MHRNQELLIVSTINLAIDIIANFIFMQFFGVAGIALATSLVFVISFAILLVAVMRALSYESFQTEKH